MDFWVWVVILFVAWALEALATAAKKRREGPPARGRPSSPPQRLPSPQPPQRRPVARRPAPVIIHRPDEPRGPVGGEPDFSSETEERYRVEVPVKRAPRPRVLESTEPREGVSAEVLVPEVAAPPTGAQHLRALEKYGRSAPPARRRARRLPRRLMKLRDAIIWMEILGPPKGGR